MDAMITNNDDDLGDLHSEDGSSLSSDDDRGVCAICMDLPVAVQVASCQHGLCVQCAFQLTVKGRELPSCPFCRQKISGFAALGKLDQPGASMGKGKDSLASTPTGERSVAGAVGHA